MGRDFAIVFASLALFSCINLLPAVASPDLQLTGILQADGSLKFTLPSSCFTKVRHPSCDAQWDVDNETVAIVDKDEIKRKPSVKELTNTSVTVDTCSYTARYFIECHGTGFRMDIVYMCVTPTSAPKSPVSPNGTISSLPIPETRHDHNHRSWVAVVSRHGAHVEGQHHVEGEDTEGTLSKYMMDGNRKRK